MEQLGKTEYTFKAIALMSDGERMPFSLSIFDGGKEGTNYFCWVRCHLIRKDDLKILNIGKDEAFKDSLDFVRNFLQHSETQLIGEDGRQIELPPLDSWNN